MKPLLLASFLASSHLTALAANPPPKFQEILDLVRTNLSGLAPGEIEQAALSAFLRQLDGKVLLDETTAAAFVPPAGPMVSKSTVYGDEIGYVRLSHVGPKLGEAMSAAISKLGGAEKLRGLVLDLRYAGGSDQKSAARAVDPFLAAERVLLSVEGEALRSTAKTNALQLPTAILVNRHTSGAAEVLAALLRQNQVGLLIGTGTPGSMRQYREFTLSTGQKLRIATAEPSFGDGKAIASGGLRPDIAVTVGEEEELVFYAEPYRNLGRAGNIVARDGHGKGSPTRLTEAELVRRMKEGQNSEAAPAVATTSASTPEIRDPTLARALDLLKALAIVRPVKP